MTPNEFDEVSNLVGRLLAYRSAHGEKKVRSELLKHFPEASEALLNVDIGNHDANMVLQAACNISDTAVRTRLLDWLRAVPE